MIDLFDSRAAHPMLIGMSGEAFDSPDFTFELKLDGERCLAYLEKGGAVLVNKRGSLLLQKVPELAHVGKQVKKRCILDCELCVFDDGKPDFSLIQRRVLSGDRWRIARLSALNPACLVAFDILYCGDRPLTSVPLYERKQILRGCLSESELLSLSRETPENGRALYRAACEKGLEGIVAKRTCSLYHMGARTREWIKIKNLMDEDFAVCGYELSPPTASLVCGRFDGARFTYGCRCTVGLSSPEFSVISLAEKGERLFPCRGESIQWLKPVHVCTVKFMEYTKSGGLRQPIFKCLRTDKSVEPGEKLF